MQAVIPDRQKSSANGASKPSSVERWFVIGLCVLACILAFLLEAHKGLDLGDEGFLWYGAQRVLHGGVPVRDFLSYDIGRYYFSAFVMSLLGSHGVVALRAALLCFGAVGISLGSWLVHSCRPRRQWWLTATAVLIFTLWMIPRHKLFDITASIILVGGLNYLLSSAKPRAFFIYGLLAGLAAVIGRNHGLYAVFALLLSLPLLLLRTEKPQWLKCLPSCAAGILVGYMPVIGLALFDGGFRQGLIRDICFNLFQYTPLPLPVPWPWLVLSGGAFNWQDLGVGLAYVGLLAFNLLGLSAMLCQALRRRPIDPLFAACVLVSLGYTHHAFSRAGYSHLAQGIFPMLIGTLVILRRVDLKLLWKLPAVALIAFVSAMATLPAHPAYVSYHKHWVPVKIGRDTLVLEPAMAGTLTGVITEVQNYAPDGNIMVAPFWPGLYATLEHESPIFDIYALFNRSSQWQMSEIEQLQKHDPQLVILLNGPMDGKDSRRFSNTNALIYDYVRRTYAQVNCPVGRDLELAMYRRRTHQ